MRPGPRLSPFYPATDREGAEDGKGTAGCQALSLECVCFTLTLGVTTARDRGALGVRQMAVEILAPPGKLLAYLCLSFLNCKREPTHKVAAKMT